MSIILGKSDQGSVQADVVSFARKVTNSCIPIQLYSRCETLESSSIGHWKQKVKFFVAVS